MNSLSQNTSSKKFPQTKFNEPFGQAEKVFLTTIEAARYLGISMQSIYKLTHQKAFPTYKPGNKKIYIRRADIDEWIEKSIRKSSSQINKESIKKFNK
jgi:excisionase family DNA binding protein